MDGCLGSKKPLKREKYIGFGSKKTLKVHKGLRQKRRWSRFKKILESEKYRGFDLKNPKRS